MRYLVPAGASMSVIAAALLCAGPACAQDASETTSGGERYEYEDTYEYGTGSTIYTVNFRALVGTDEIGVGSMSRYFQYFTPEEIAQTAPSSHSYYIGSAIVSITGWSAPQFVDSQYDVIDVFSQQTHYDDVLSFVTTQTTSGDGPDAVVPHGWRGNCYADGASGATNFGLFDGQFAACDYADSESTVAAGTINTNTHTTTVYRQGTHYFESVDDGYTDTYLFLPTATSTSSSGERYESAEITEYGAGSTTYHANIAVEIGGEQTPLTDLSRFSGAYGQSEVEQAIPGSFVHMYQGVPVRVDAWSAPQLVDSAYETVDVFTEDSTSSETFDVVTVQTTSGDGPDAVVPIGWRGFCGSDGASGATNFAASDGAFAQCEGADGYLSVTPGSTNTNTHTTMVTRETFRHFEIVDDAYTDFYVVRPSATSTSSFGERSEFVTIDELSRSTTYAVNIAAEIGGEQVALADLAPSSVAYDQSDVEQAIPAGSFMHMYQGVPVTVIAWSTPQLVDTSYEVVNVDFSDFYYTQDFEVVTVQTTSGDGADAVVPIGWRGSCDDDGTSGATNFASSDGAFAQCGGAAAYLPVAPGSTNTNTHTTYVTRDVTEYSTSVHDAYDDSYLVRPTATATSSFGERSEFVTIDELSRSTTYAVNIAAEIGGEQVALADLAPSSVAYDQSDVEQAIPAGSFMHMYQGVPVTVTAWSTPQLVDTSYEVVNVDVSEFSYTEDFELVTVQTTSGDGADALVPIGSRGSCDGDGASGATNFASSDGAFAQCGGAAAYLPVTPGSTNTNTHTTYVTRDVTEVSTSVDDAYDDSYLVRPAATSTASRGTLEILLPSSLTVRNDSYATHIAGVAGGETLIDQTVVGAFGDAGVQSALETLSRPLGRGFGGAPAVVVWSSPVLTASREVLSSSTTATDTNTRNFEVLTVTQALGGAVSIGNRGTCTSTGTSGVATGASPTGTFAECQGGVSYALSPGETNTNTHTTDVTLRTVNTLITENWLTSDAYLLTGTPVLIGQIHSAVRDALFAGGEDFAGKHREALDNSREGFGLWASLETGEGNTGTDAAGPGNRRDTRGGAGGISFRLSDLARIGVAVSHGSTDTRLKGIAEEGDIELTQIGAALDLQPGIWRIRLTASHGWGDIATERGSAAIGGVATADYDATTWYAAAEAGPELGTAGLSIRPLVAVEWSRATLGVFAERGGIALQGTEDSATRLAASLGVEAASQWELPGGASIRVWADARVSQVLDGEDRDRAVALVADPDDLLLVTSASEGGTQAEGRAGISLFTPGGLGVHLSARGRTGDGGGGWRATAGVSAAF